MSKKIGIKSSKSLLKTVEEGEKYLKKQWGSKKLKEMQEGIEERQRKLDNKETIKRRSSKDSERSATPELPAKKLKTASTTSSSTTRAKLNKTRTMAATTKEAKNILNGTNIDTDAKTRRQSKAIEELINKNNEDKLPSAKKSLRKSTTMKKTAKEGEERVLKGEKLSSTRSKTKANVKNKIAKKIIRKSTMQRTLNEASKFLRNSDTSKKRTTSADNTHASTSTKRAIRKRK